MRGMGGAALLALAAPASAQEEVELPAWMAGCWEMRDGERWADECWMSPRGGVMLGAGRSGSSAETTSWEAMQIIIADRVAAGDGAIPKMTFWASPDGQSRTPFVWSPHERDGVTFFNLANDYPQRVHYWRDGALLKAEISMADGSKPMRWTFAPAGGE